MQKRNWTENRLSGISGMQNDDDDNDDGTSEPCGWSPVREIVQFQQQYTLKIIATIRMSAIA